MLELEENKTTNRQNEAGQNTGVDASITPLNEPQQEVQNSLYNNLNFVLWVIVFILDVTGLVFVFSMSLTGDKDAITEVANAFSKAFIGFWLIGLGSLLGFLGGLTIIQKGIKPGLFGWILFLVSTCFVGLWLFCF